MTDYQVTVIDQFTLQILNVFRLMPERQTFLMIHPSFNIEIFPIEICLNSQLESGMSLEDVSSKGIYGTINLKEKLEPLCQVWSSTSLDTFNLIGRSFDTRNMLRIVKITVL